LTTDGEARCYFAKAPSCASWGHLWMENRSGLVVAARLKQATGLAEREAAGRLIEDLPTGTGLWSAPTRLRSRGLRLSDCASFNATPRSVQNFSGRSRLIDCRTVRHLGYLASQRARKWIEDDRPNEELDPQCPFTEAPC
jgi:hypothetical protein